MAGKASYQLKNKVHLKMQDQQFQQLEQHDLRLIHRRRKKLSYQTLSGIQGYKHLKDF